MRVHSVIGIRVNDKKLRDKVNLELDSLKRVTNLNNLLLLEDPRKDGWSWLCTYCHTFSEGYNEGPLVVYRDHNPNWDEEKVRSVLEPLSLWIPGQFGLWTILAKQ